MYNFHQLLLLLWTPEGSRKGSCSMISKLSTMCCLGKATPWCSLIAKESSYFICILPQSKPIFVIPNLTKTPTYLKLIDD